MKTQQKHFLRLWPVAVFAILVLGVFSCGGPSVQERDAIEDIPQSEVEPPEWSHNANIYEVNIRQYTPEGTFDAFSQHLERLDLMGVEILWLMPVQPIGVENRKGSLGSYYSIQDYTAVNPEFGTMDDLRTLIMQIHEQDMKVIIDWVANHTSWDHEWTETHPEFYQTDEQGNFMPPVEDWSDVIALNYDNRELWDTMIAEMRFWVEEMDVDGFRCDVADMVPTEFWERAIEELEEVKPLFMLAEAENQELHMKAFEMGYGWELHHIMNRIGLGDASVLELDRYFFLDTATWFPFGTYRMNFITNHDENSWSGSELERLGQGVEPFAVLTATVPGMILIYNGQEAALDRRLEFFEKDSITWDGYVYHEFYKALLELKADNEALWNGAYGGDLERVHTNQDQEVFAFVREKDDQKVFVVLNLSEQDVTATFRGEDFTGVYTTLFTDEPIEIEEDFTLNMEPWAYFVFYK